MHLGKSAEVASKRRTRMKAAGLGGLVGLQHAFACCGTEEPALRLLADGHFAACHLNELPAAENPMVVTKN
jgi:hypothetical protein